MRYEVIGVRAEKTPRSHCRVTRPVVLSNVAAGGVIDGADPTACATPPAAQCAAISVGDKTDVYIAASDARENALVDRFIFGRTIKYAVDCEVIPPAGSACCAAN